MEYQFIGQAQRTYPDIVHDGAVLVAEPGDARWFDGEPPSDGLWVKLPEPKPTKKADPPAKPSKES